MGYIMDHSIGIHYFVGLSDPVYLRVGVKAAVPPLCEGTINTVIALKLLLSQTQFPNN